MAAVTSGTTTIGIKFKDRAVLIADKRLSSKFIEAASVEKIYEVDEHIEVYTSRMVSDAG